MDDQLTSQDFYRSDPVHRFLRDRLKLGIPLLIVVQMALNAFGLGLLPILLHAPLTGTEPLITLVEVLAIIPVGLGVCLLLPGALARLFNTLQSNRVIGGPLPPYTEPYPEFRRRLLARIDSPIWAALGAAVVIGYWLYRLLVSFPGDLVLNAAPEYQLGYRVAILAGYSLPLYLGIGGLSRFVETLLGTGRLFRRFHILVNPLHPDGSAGLRPVGHMLSNSIVVATVFGVAVGAMIILKQAEGAQPFTRAETWAGIGMYLVGLPALFIGWLWAPHEAMLAAREAVLTPLADEYQRMIPGASPSAQDTAGTIKDSTDRLAEIKRQYDLLRDTYPVWPIHGSVLSRLVATALLPVVTSLVPAFLGQLIKSALNIAP